MADAIGSCVHCGFCLPTCPTYVTGGEEPHSPRGRIFLMKDVLEGSSGSRRRCAPIDSCLGCQACVTACPSGVEYGELITAFRAHAEPRRPLAERATRALAAHTLPYPRRFRAAAPARSPGAEGRRRCGRCSTCCPTACRRRGRCPPSSRPRARAARGSRCWPAARSRCSSPTIGWATLRVLARNGVETVVPRGQGCCGALAMHGGRAAQARRLARRNLRAFPTASTPSSPTPPAAARACASTGCCSRASRTRSSARELAARVVDVSAFLDELGLRGAAGAGRRCASPTTTRATWRTRRRCARRRAAAASGRPRGRRAGRVGAVLRLGRDLQRRAAGDGRRARPPQGGQPARHRGATWWRRGTSAA